MTEEALPNEPFALSDKICYTYDMADHRISVRIPEHLGERLRQKSQLKGAAESELVREALESYLTKQVGAVSAYEAAVAAGVIGCAKRSGMPKDLSTNPKHFEGFGES